MPLIPDAEMTPSDGTTVTAVLAAFDEEGFGPTLFATDAGKVRCTACRAEIEPQRMQVEALRRLEGASDPDDMLAVVAATCPSCWTPGAMVLHYGPMAAAGDADVLALLAD